MEQDLVLQPQAVPVYDGPGSANDRAVDIGSLDPLVNLGLVDPKSGAALPTEEWQPSTPPAQQVAAPAPAPQAAPQAAQPQQAYELQVAILQSYAAQAYNEAIARGVDPGAAQSMIGAKLEGEIAKARAASREAAVLPAVRQMVAQKIAQTHGANQVRPEELLAYQSPQEMETAASQLAAARRQSNYQSRVSSGADRTESGSPARGLAPAIAGLSSEKKIELGIRRGQFS